MANPSPPWDIENLIKRFDKSRSLWQLWRSIHQEAYDYSMPDRETFRWRSPGQRKNRFIFDSTAVDGLEVYANKVQGGFFPDWLNWMEFKAGDEIPNEDKKAADRELDGVTEKFFGFFHQSNFSTEVNPALKDWGVGTGAIEVEEGRFDTDEPMYCFTNVPLAEVSIERPARGAVKNSWREHEVEAHNIKQTWPEADLTDDLKQMEKDKPLSKVKVLNAHLYDPDKNEYWQIIIYKPRKHILFSQKFKTKRRIVFRASVTPGEAYGRGPIIRLLPDIRTANKVKQFILENAALQMAGVYTGVDDGVFNPHTVRIAPGSIIPVTSNNSQNPTLSTLPRSGDIGIGAIVLEDLQDHINRALLASPIGDISDPVRTATENVIRMQQDLKRQGAAFGRLYSELVVPLVKACLDIGIERGVLPDMRADGKEVKIKMVSPLAKQQDMEEFQNSQAWYSMIQQLDPSIRMGSVREEDLPGFWADKLSVPSGLQRSEKERKQLSDMIMSFVQSQLGGAGEGA